jgi:hypothetical protein
MNFKLSADECKKLKQLKDSISEELDSLRGLESEEKQYKNEEIKSLIRYYQTLTEEIENRRNRIYNFTLQFLVICLAGVGLLFSWKRENHDLIFWEIIIVLGLLIIFSLVIIIVYEFQSRFRYSFLCLKEYGNKWKWFYYGNQHIMKINVRPFPPSKNFSQTLEPYLSGLNEFIRNYREENIDKEISNNIQQLYLLQVHNYYKNRFYLQLTNLRLYSIIVTVVIAIIIYLIFYVFSLD